MLSKEDNLEVSTEKAKCMFMSHHQNAIQNHNMQAANKYSINVDKVHMFGNNSNKSKLHL